MKEVDISLLAADPVISEMRRAKTAVGQKYGFDVLAMVRALRALDEQENANMVEAADSPAIRPAPAGRTAEQKPRDTGSRESRLTLISIINQMKVTMLHLRKPHLILALGMLLHAGTNLCLAQESEFPGQNWRTATPESQGWSGDGLRAADEVAKSIGTDAYLVIHKGRIVHEYGDVARVSNVHSVRKSVLSILVGIHADRGTIPLDNTLAQLHIDDKDILTETEKQATIRHLLQARSGVYHPSAYFGQASVLFANCLFINKGFAGSLDFGEDFGTIRPPCVAHRIEIPVLQVCLNG